MKKAIVALMSLVALNTQAILLTPTSSSLLLWGPESSQSAIQAIIDASYPGLDLLYKGTRDGNNSAGISSEAFSSSYATTFFNTDLADSDARISYVGGTKINSSPVYAYIKDGNATPNWFFFNITGWDGSAPVEFEGFFIGVNKKGQPQIKDVSHVSIYGNQRQYSPVPDAGAIQLLLSLAVMGLAGVRRLLA